MNFEEKNKSPEDIQLDTHADAQVAEALRHFRESMYAWSEVEYTKPRLVVQSKPRSFLSQLALGMTTPLAGWSFAVIVLGTTVGVPVSVHHQHVIAAQKQEALLKERKLAAEQEVQAEQARLAAMNDDELMSHVDSDIAQDAPDAMEALSNLMNSSNSNQ